MSTYEVLCNGVTEARVFSFNDLDKARAEAERLCRAHKIEVRVVQVIGLYVPEARWVPTAPAKS